MPVTYIWLVFFSNYICSTLQYHKLFLVVVFCLFACFLIRLHFYLSFSFKALMGHIFICSEPCDIDTYKN